MRDLNRAVRRIVRLYDLYLDDHDEVRMIRRVQKRPKKKKKKCSSKPVFKYDVEVPKNALDAQRIDLLEILYGETPMKRK